MNELIEYAKSEIERAEAISEPLREMFDNEELLDNGQDVDMNYYEGYADGMRAIINKYNLQQKGK